MELEKLERRDPLKKFSEKVAVAKTVEGHEASIGTDFFRTNGSSVASRAGGGPSITVKNSE